MWSRIVAPIAGAVGLASLVFAGLAGVLWVRVAAIVVAAAAVGALLLQLGRVATRLAEEGSRWRAETEAVRALLHRIDERLDRTEQQVDSLVEEVDQLPGPVTDTDPEPVSEADRELLDRVQRGVYARVEAHTDLRALLTPRAPMPPLDGWALDADIMHLVARLLWSHAPELIVECGSGSSSVWLGYLVELRGTGRVVALEHDPGYLQASCDLVQLHGLEDVVEIRHAPLRPWSDESGDAYRWYSQSALAELTEIGLVLVDGPPGTTGRNARYPALPLLLPRCADQAVLILDDADRPDERAISDRWHAERPDLTRTGYCRGRAHVFVRDTGNKSA